MNFVRAGEEHGLVAEEEQGLRFARLEKEAELRILVLLRRPPWAFSAAWVEEEDQGLQDWTRLVVGWEEQEAVYARTSRHLRLVVGL